MIESIVRFQICANLLLASLVAFFEIPIPRLFPGVISHIVKRVSCYLDYNGEQDCESVCEEVQSSQHGTCDLAEADEQSDGEPDGSNEDGSGSSGEHEPDGGENDKSA